MDKHLSDTEKEKIFKLCLENPDKACAIAQEIIDSCQLMSCRTYAVLKDKSPRTVQYKAEKLRGISIEKRRFVSLIQ